MKKKTKNYVLFLMETLFFISNFVILNTNALFSALNTIKLPNHIMT